MPGLQPPFTTFPEGNKLASDGLQGPTFCMMTEIEQNLADFFTHTGEVTGCTLIRHSFFSGVQATPGQWPSLIYGPYSIPAEELLPRVGLWMDMHREPALLAANDSYLNRTLGRVLRETRFFPVDRWLMMDLDLQEYKLPGSATSQSNLQTLRTPASFVSFAAIVNRELLGNRPVDPSLLLQLAASEQVLFPGLFLEQNLVSGMLVFSHLRTAGLYLVATQHDHQGKGYGTLLLNGVLSYLKRTGIRRVVLHASQSAVPFYRKAGFESHGQLVIYQKI